MKTLDLFAQPKFKPIDRTNFEIRTGYLADNFDLQFLNWFYQGLKESNPSGKVFDVLNGDEIASLCVGTYITKKNGLISNENLKNSSEIELIEENIITGMPSLNKRKDLLIKNKKLDEKINPYKNFKLEDRLLTIDPLNLASLKYHLSRSPKTYVPECKYSTEKALRDGDNSDIEIMYFLPVYPKKGHDYRKLYAREIMGILKNKYREINK